MKTLTVRLSEDLDCELTKYAKEEDMSKNQLIKIAVRNWLKELKKREHVR